MSVKEKLDEYDLFDNSIIRHGGLDNVRDYEIIGYLVGQDFDLEVRYVSKGCINVRYENTVEPKYFSMDDRLLDLERQTEPDYPRAFVWGAGVVAYPGWKLEENTDELNHLESLYNIEFHKLDIETNAYNLTLIFHDVEITPLKRCEKSVLYR